VREDGEGRREGGREEKACAIVLYWCVCVFRMEREEGRKGGREGRRDAPYR